MSGGSSRGRYGDRMGVWNGPVNEHVTADLFVRAPFFKADAFHHEIHRNALVGCNLKVKPLIGEMLFLDRNLRIDCLFATTLQTLI